MMLTSSPNHELNAARRFELKPVDLGAEQRSGLWQEAVKRVAGSQEAATKRVRDSALIRLTVDVSLSPESGISSLQTSIIRH